MTDIDLVLREYRLWVFENRGVPQGYPSEPSKRPSAKITDEMAGMVDSAISALRKRHEDVGESVLLDALGYPPARAAQQLGVSRATHMRLVYAGKLWLDAALFYS